MQSNKNMMRAMNGGGGGRMSWYCLGGKQTTHLLLGLPPHH